MNLAQPFEKSAILKYFAEPMGATAYLKMPVFPNAHTIFHVSMWGFGYYFHNESMPLFLLSVFGKNEKGNLSHSERNLLAKFTLKLVKNYGG